MSCKVCFILSILIYVLNNNTMPYLVFPNSLDLWGFIYRFTFLDFSQLSLKTLLFPFLHFIYFTVIYGTLCVRYSARSWWYIKLDSVSYLKDNLIYKWRTHTYHSHTHMYHVCPTISVIGAKSPMNTEYIATKALWGRHDFIKGFQCFTLNITLRIINKSLPPLPCSQEHVNQIFSRKGHKSLRFPVTSWPIPYSSFL